MNEKIRLADRNQRPAGRGRRAARPAWAAPSSAAPLGLFAFRRLMRLRRAIERGEYSAPMALDSIVAGLLRDVQAQCGKRRAGAAASRVRG